MRPTSIAPSETPPPAAALALPAGVMSVSSRKEDARQKPGSVGIATADSGGRGALAASPMQSTSKNLKQRCAEDSGGQVTEPNGAYEDPHFSLTAVLPDLHVRPRFGATFGFTPRYAHGARGVRARLRVLLLPEVRNAWCSYSSS